MFDVSVVYILRSGPGGDEVLLGEKLTGLGVGKIVGPGGKLEQGETPHEAAIREVREEVGVRVERKALIPIARIEYPFVDRPHLSQRSHAFVATAWDGVVAASDELSATWWPVDGLPFDRMWSDATLWLNRALAGEFLQATFSIGGLDQVTTQEMTWSRWDDA
jgi:8-oxo-dGTP diphosphatase